jgi:transposase
VRRALGGLRGRLWAEEDALQPLRTLGRARHLGGHLQRTRQHRRGRPIVHRFELHQGPSLRRRRKRGGLAHGIGRTKGGRNTKLHAVCDSKGRPLVLVLTPGNTHDCKVAQHCIEALPPSAELVADKGYDSRALREWLEARGTTPVIPPRSYRKVQYAYDRATYRQRNIIERMFCRLKDWRRIATRYDRCATTFFGAITLAAIVTFWLGQ